MIESSSDMRSPLRCLTTGNGSVAVEDKQAGIQVLCKHVSFHYHKAQILKCKNYIFGRKKWREKKMKMKMKRLADKGPFLLFLLGVDLLLLYLRLSPLCRHCAPNIVVNHINAPADTRNKAEIVLNQPTPMTSTAGKTTPVPSAANAYRNR
jgi:hypothetical protein